VNSDPGCTDDEIEPFVIDCPVDTLTSGASKSFTIAWSAPDSPGSYNLYAQVGSSDDNFLDPNSVNNFLESTLVVSPPTSDLSITKTESSDPLINGSKLIYTLTVQNAGPDAAPATQLVDSLPAGETFVSVTGASCSGTSVMTCGLKTLAAKATVKIMLTVNVNLGSVPGSVSNTATVSSSNFDSNIDNNTATASTTVLPPYADLSITKGDAPDPVVNGTNLTHTLTVKNNGGIPVTGATVTDTLPAGETLVSAKGCSGTAPITCTLAKLAVNASAKVTIVVTVSLGSVPGTVSNTATVSSSLYDPTAGNNSATQVTTVNPPYANLHLTANASPTLVIKGGKVTYVFTIKNLGPQAATSLVFQETLPDAVTLPATAPVGCSFSGHVMTCSGLTVNANATKVFTVVVTAPMTGGTTLMSSGTVSSAVLDPVPGDNSATATSTTKP
jgi:uncharacterized repeat protein (TIGR01451 family)